MSSPIRSAGILFKEAEKLGLKPKLLTEYGVFLVEVSRKKIYLFDGRTILNNQMAAYIAENKHVTRLILQKEQLPNIPFLLPETYEEAVDFLHVHEQLILKPTLGTNAEGVYLIDSETKLKNYDLTARIMEKYIAGREFRYLVLDNEVIAVHERQHTGEINVKQNVRRISYPEETWDTELTEVAKKTSRALNLRFSAVDFLITSENAAFILEVNSAPGIAWFHEPSEGPAVNVAKMILEKTMQEVSQ
jgi:glutathione synthase/RimK-type ligase-like ATP-grasp enzyme